MAHPEELAAQQMRRWELDRKLRERFERDERQAGPCSSVITISRERGSGGAIIGKILAKELDWKYYDREIIDQLAEHMGAPPEQVAYHDERPPQFVRTLLMQLLEGHRPTEGQYLRALVKLLRRIRSEGNAVVMGRGAALVIPDALRVRIVAPEDIRVERIADLDSLSLAEARREVALADKEREQFVRAHFGVEPADSTHFDLVVNTGSLSLEHAVALIICALRNRTGACPT